MIHRHGFLCATPQIQLSVAFQQSLGAGIFGGEGFLLQRVSGLGTAWIELSGELIVKDLQPGETLRVHPGHVGAFESRVPFQITTVPGIKNMIFGGDGIFLASLTGPGRIWLKTLPISQLAHKLMEISPDRSSEQTYLTLGSKAPALTLDCPASPDLVIGYAKENRAMNLRPFGIQCPGSRIPEVTADTLQCTLYLCTTERHGPCGSEILCKEHGATELHCICAQGDSGVVPFFRRR